MKLNQTVKFKHTDQPRLGWDVTPRPDRISFRMGAYQDQELKVLTDKHVSFDLDPAEAISTGTALIAAGEETRKAIETDELDRRQRETTQALPAHFKGLREALTAYLDTQKIAIFRDEAKDALSLVDRAYRLMAQNQSGTAKGTGYYLSAKDQMTDRLAEPTEKTYTLSEAVKHIAKAGVFTEPQWREHAQDATFTVEQLDLIESMFPHWQGWVAKRKHQLKQVATTRQAVLDAHAKLQEAQAIGNPEEIERAEERLASRRWQLELASTPDTTLD